MKVLFCAGGTLGHIYPALALCELYHKKYPSDTLFLLVNEKDLSYLENTSINVELKILSVKALGFSKSPVKLVKAAFTNILAYKKIKQILIKYDIKQVWGMGGFISGILIKAAFKEKIFSIIHEQNSVIGLANKMSLKYADVFLETFPLKEKHKNKLLIGNPRFYMLKNKFYTKKAKNSILITSGTLGAKKINELALAFLGDEESKKYYTTLITGKRYYDEVMKKKPSGNHFEILPFSSSMVSLIKKNQVIIMRSGSTTIFEALALEAVPIFIPSPNVVKNHQYYNALNITKQGIGKMLKEEDANALTLKSLIKETFQNYEKMQKAVKEFNQKTDLDELFKFIEERSRKKNE